MDFTSATFSRINVIFTPKDLEMGETWFAVEVSKMHSCANMFIKEVIFFFFN